jgi:hypothetical protein
MPQRWSRPADRLQSVRAKWAPVVRGRSLSNRGCVESARVTSGLSTLGYSRSAVWPTAVECRRRSGPSGVAVVVRPGFEGQCLAITRLRGRLDELSSSQISSHHVIPSSLPRSHSDRPSRLPCRAPARRGGGVAAVRLDPAPDRPTARPASAGDLKRRNGAAAEAERIAMRRKVTSGIGAAPSAP